MKDKDLFYVFPRRKVQIEDWGCDVDTEAQLDPNQGYKNVYMSDFSRCLLVLSNALHIHVYHISSIKHLLLINSGL